MERDISLLHSALGKQIETIQRYGPHYCVMLENTVIGVPILKSVKNQADHDKAHGRGPLSYDNYITLLLSVAAVHDAENSVNHRRKFNAYNINQ